MQKNIERNSIGLGYIERDVTFLGVQGYGGQESYAEVKR